MKPLSVEDGTKEMSKYVVSGVVTISVHTKVEALSPQEALDIAQDRGLIGLCHQCAGGNPGEEWITSGELDGVPSDLKAEEDSDDE